MTDFREMIRRDAGGAAANEAPESPFRAMIRRDREAQAQTAAASARLAPLDPEGYSKAVADSREIGLPAEVIARNPEEAKALTVSKRMSEVTKAHPKLGTWFSRDDNAAIASDDTEGLGKVASEMLHAAQSFGALGLVNRFAPNRVTANIQGTVEEQVGMTVAGAGRLVGAKERDVVGFTHQIAGLFGEQAEARSRANYASLPSWATAAGLLESPTKDIGSAVIAKGRAMKPQEQNFFDRVVGAGTQLGMYAVTGGTGASLQGLAQGAEMGGERAEEFGASQQEVDDAATASAMITGASELVGFKFLTRAIPPGLKGMFATRVADILKSGGAEAAQEYVEGVGNNLVASLVYDPEAAILTTPGSNGEAEAGVAAGLFRTIFHVRDRLGQADQAEKGADGLDKIVKAATESKTAARDPARLQALIGELAEPGMDTVYLPAEKLETYFQAQGLDAAQMVEAATGDPDAFAVARIANGDVAVPVGAYVALWGKDHHAALSSSARLAPDGIPASEAESARKEAQAAVDEMLAADPPEAGGVDAVAAELTNMLVSTGRYGPDEARAAAVIPARTIAGIAKLQGIDPMVLLQQQGLSITSGETGERAGRLAPKSDMTDVLLDQVRAGGDPRQSALFSKMQGPSLLAFLAKKGGVQDLGGDLKSMGAAKQRPGLVSGKGMTLDDAYTAAVEAGYLPGITAENMADTDGVNAIIDAIGSELNGDAIFSEEGKKGPEKFLSAYNDILSALQEADADVGNMTNAQLKRLLFGETFEQSPVGSFDNPLPESEMESAPVGAWVAGPRVPGVDSRRVVMEVPLDQIDPTEFDSAGEIAPEKRADAKKYAAAMAKGDRFPNLRGSELPSGKIKLQDGHRRYWAARANGDDSVRVAVDTIEKPATGGTFNQGPRGLSDIEAQRGIDPVEADRDRADWEKFGADARKKMAGMGVREWVEWEGKLSAGMDPERETAMLANIKAGGERAEFPYYYAMKDKLAKAKSERDTLTALAKTDDAQVLPDEQKAEEPSFWRRFFQPAYHGTPHDVDRFSLQKIGTGEGAQAFGWGLYFASAKEVAEAYQKNVKDMDSVRRINDRLSKLAKIMSDDEVSGSYRKYRSDAGREAAAEYDRLMDEREGVSNAPGKLYKVEVPDDGDLLDYDKPLSEQGEIADGLLLKLDDRMNAGAAVARHNTGAGLYAWLAEQMGGEQQASEYLQGYGIPGLRYADGNTRGKDGEKTHNYVIWDEAAISEPTRLEQTTSKPRGAITFADGKATIQLFEGMDLSTFQHEMAHFNLELFKSMAEADGATDQLKAEYAKIEAYLGAKAGAKLTEAQHETFARSVEAYLYEGVAPTESLRPAFARVSAWMRAVYSSLKSLNVNLTPEVREVFDRLLAADEEVIAAEERQDYAPVFKDAKSMGVSESRFNAYLDAIQDAHDRAVQRATKAVLNPVKKRLTKEYRLLRESIREQVVAEVQADPLQQAIANLQRGTLPDGSPLPAGIPAMKLNRAAVTDQMGTAFAKALPRGVLSDEGAPADMVAAAYGFPSADAFLLALSRAPNRKAYIAAESDARARATLEDPLVNGTMAEVAMAAAHNTVREAAITLEMERLAELANVPRPDVRALNLAAQTRVAGMKSRDLRPSQYLRAERTAANEAAKAAGKQKWPDAFKAKREQAINAALYRAALAQQAKTDSNLRFLRKQGEPRTMQRLGKAGPEYLDAMELLLEAYELKAVTYARQRSRESLRGWYDRMLAAGETPIIGDEVMEQVEAARKTNFSQLTGRQVQALKDAAANVSALARGNLEAIVQGKKVELMEIDLGLAEAVRAANFSGRPKPVDPAAEGWFQKQRRSFSALAAVLFRPEAIVNWIDGESNVNGWAHRTFMRPLNEAQAAERDLTKQYTERVFKAIQANVAASGHLSDIVATATLGGEFTRGGLIAAALNMGNAGNLQRMRDGNGWGPVQQAEVLSKLTRADAEFVQSLWDIIDSLWPQIAALEQRVTGVKPPKTEAVPLTFTTSDGHEITLAGGYFPIMYDKDSPQFQRLNKSTDSSPFEGGYVSAFTSHGFTKTREREVKIPLLFDLNAVPRHLTDVIHDLTHREALLTAWKVLNGTEVTAAFNETGSGVLRDTLKFKLKQVANGAVLMGGGPLSVVGKFSRGVRRRISVVGLGLNVVSGLKQVLGVSSALSRLQAASDGTISGAKAFAAGYYDMLKGWGPGLEEVREQSGEMRHRMDTAASDVRQAMDRHLSGMAGGGVLGTAAKVEDAIQRTAYIPIIYVQFYTVDLPTYYAGLRIAKAKGLTGADAVAFAESQVRRSQGAGGVKDEATIENQPVAEWFLTFYSYFSTYLNEQITLGRATKSAATNRKLMAMMPVLASRAALLMILPPILEDLVNQAIGRSEGPPDDEDEESQVAYYLKLILPYLGAGVPLVRDIARGAASPYGYTATPVGQLGESFLRVYKDLGKAADPDEEVETRKIVMDSLSATSYAFGLPLVAPGRQVDYLVRVMNGDEEPESNSEFWLALLGGKKESK